VLAVGRGGTRSRFEVGDFCVAGQRFPHLYGALHVSCGQVEAFSYAMSRTTRRSGDGVGTAMSAHTSMSEAKVYSERLGPISDSHSKQSRTASACRFLSAEPVTIGCSGRMSSSTTTGGAFVLRVHRIG